MLIRDVEYGPESNPRCLRCGKPAEIYASNYASDEELTWCQDCAMQLAHHILADLCALTTKGGRPG